MKSVWGLLVLAVAAVSGEATWEDTDATTALWKAISGGDITELEKLLEEDKDAALARAADGRGPLW